MSVAAIRSIYEEKEALRIATEAGRVAAEGRRAAARKAAETKKPKGVRVGQQKQVKK